MRTNLVFFILTIFSNLPLSATELNCDWKKISDDSFQLTVLNLSETIAVNGRNSKLLKCEKSEVFDNILIVEVDMGTAGTHEFVNEHQLYLWDTKFSPAKKLGEWPLGEIIQKKTKGKNEKLSDLMSYEIRKSPTGKISVYWPHSKTFEELKSKK